MLGRGDCSTIFSINERDRNLTLNLNVLRFPNTLDLVLLEFNVRTLFYNYLVNFVFGSYYNEKKTFLELVLLSNPTSRHC